MACMQKSQLSWHMGDKIRKKQIAITPVPRNGVFAIQSDAGTNYDRSFIYQVAIIIFAAIISVILFSPKKANL
jgi:hypothetical protein